MKKKEIFCELNEHDLCTCRKEDRDKDRNRQRE